MLIPFSGSSEVDKYFDTWRADDPTFLWLPTTQEGTFRDIRRQVSGLPSDSIQVGLGGVQNPVANGSGVVSFPTTLGLGTSGQFFAMLMVYIPDPANATGAFLKIGSGSDGIAVGAGGTTFENTGTKLIVLREGLAWHVSTAAAFVKGINVLAFYRTSGPIFGAVNMTTGVSIETPSATYTAPTVGLTINGSGGIRGSNATVNGVGIWPGTISNATLVARRAALAAPMVGLYGRDYKPLFALRRNIAFATAASGAFKSAWARGANTVISSGARP